LETQNVTELQKQQVLSQIRNAKQRADEVAATLQARIDQIAVDNGAAEKEFLERNLANVNNQPRTTAAQAVARFGLSVVQEAFGDDVAELNALLG
jgi:hypothetical protein